MEGRPLECSQCKKPICVIYKEIANNSLDVSQMCEHCPILKRKLHGEQPENPGLKWSKGKQGLCCMNCGTSLDTLGVSSQLGCSECYSIFEHVIAEILHNENLIPKKMKTVMKKTKQCQLHVGKSPHVESSPLLSTQMTDLHTALRDALKKENYEQAATLRDQIKELKEKVDEGA